MLFRLFHGDGYDEGTLSYNCGSFVCAWAECLMLVIVHKFFLYIQKLNLCPQLDQRDDGM